MSSNLTVSANMQKPVIIYHLPRVRSHAILSSCKRENKFFEPFALYRMTAPVGDAFTLYPRPMAEAFNRWPELELQLNQPSSATKFTGVDLMRYYPARKWFTDVDAAGTHDIFIPIRDFRELCLSFIIAMRFGFVKEQENTSVFKHSTTEPFTVSTETMSILILCIDNFLRFMPRNAKLIEFSSLPASHFDVGLNKFTNQHSLNKTRLISNLDYVNEHVDGIIKFFSAEWQEKVLSLETAK